MKNSTFEVYKEYSITQSGQDFLLLKGKKRITSESTFMYKRQDQSH